MGEEDEDEWVEADEWVERVANTMLEMLGAKGRCKRREGGFAATAGALTQIGDNTRQEGAGERDSMGAPGSEEKQRGQEEEEEVRGGVGVCSGGSSASACGAVMEFVAEAVSSGRITADPRLLRELLVQLTGVTSAGGEGPRVKGAAASAAVTAAVQLSQPGEAAAARDAAHEKEKQQQQQQHVAREENAGQPKPRPAGAGASAQPVCGSSLSSGEQERRRRESVLVRLLLSLEVEEGRPEGMVGDIPIEQLLLRCEAAGFFQVGLTKQKKQVSRSNRLGLWLLTIPFEAQKRAVKRNSPLTSEAA